MRHPHRMIFLSLLVIGCVGPSASKPDPNDDAMVDKEFVILRSSPSFDEAKRVAEEAASRIGLQLNLRGVSQHVGTGLTFSKDECESGEFEYPCYVARGRYDDGVYVSVEWSGAYSSFAQNQYVVVAASGAPGAAEVRNTLETARRGYPDAYVKTTKVYMGCMH
jgi:hypothetical protein